MNTKIDIHIGRVISHLKKLQNDDGSWDANNFATAFVLHSLRKICLLGPTIEDSLGDTLAQCEKYLLSEKSAEGTWNYYPRKNTGPKLPDDMDDTFCIMSVLPACDGLTSIEKNIGEGPYNTWICDSKENKSWQDIDPIVNANIAYFLHMRGVHKPTLISFIDSAIKKGVRSKYYHNPAVYFYFVSRGYRGSKKALLRKKIHAQLKKPQNTKAALAFLLLSLIHLNDARDHSLLSRKIAELISEKNATHASQRKMEDLYIERITGEHITYAHSKSIEEAVVGEALAAYLLLEKERTDKENFVASMKLKQKIYHAIKDRCLKLPTVVRKHAVSEINKTLLTGRRSESFLFPFFIYKNMHPEKQDVPVSLVLDTCIFGVYGWMAYTIYDSILDSDKNEGGTTDRKEMLLPVANIFYREFCVLGQSLFKKSSDERGDWYYFKKYMDAMDSAQFIDVSRLRFDTIALPTGTLPEIPPRLHVEKSIGYILPSLAMVLTTQNRSEIKKYETFFKIYIDIMQTSDDIRDWHEDLSNGILTDISRKIILEWQALGGPPEKEYLEKIFKDAVLPEKAREMLEKITAALAVIESMTIFQDKSFLRECVLPYKAPAEAVLKRCRYPAYIPRPPHTPPLPG